MARLIPLTKGQWAVVNDEDYEWLSQYKWQAWWMKNTQSYYAARCIPTPNRDRYPNGHLIQKAELMHRVILGLSGPGRKNPVDHKDGNTLNNQRSNLRIATQQQNIVNRKMMSTNTSGFKGVHLNRNRWRARLGRIHLGYFDTPEEAHAAYMQAAIEHFGEFANAG